MGAIEKLLAELDGCAGGAFGEVGPDDVSSARAELAALRTKAGWHDRGMDAVAGWVGKRETHIVDHICILGYERDRLDKECAALRAENARMREALVHARGLAGIIAADGNWAGNTWRGESRPSSTAIDLCDEINLALSVSKDAVSPRGAWLSAEQLREIEWARAGYCPALCGGTESGRSHAPDCWLAAKIKQTEEKA